MYQITYNGYTIQNSTNMTLQVFDGWSRVETRISQDFNTGTAGGNIWERQLGFRTITIKGHIYAGSSDDFTTYYSLLETMQLAFPIDNATTTETLTIVKPDGTSKSIQAKVIDIPLFTESAGEVREADFEIVLKCGNPYYSDPSTTTTSKITPGTSGGTPVPTPVPSPMGGSASSLLIVNTGDVAIYPTFQLTGKLINATVSNLTTGQSFQIATTINATETLTAGYDNYGVYVLDGTSNYFQYLVGSLFKLQVGSNQIIISASTFDTNGGLIISYAQQYKTL